MTAGIRRVLLLIAVLWFALTNVTIFPVEKNWYLPFLNVMNSNIRYSLENNTDDMDVYMIQARTILWSKNWHHHVACPTVPPTFYQRTTGIVESTEHMVDYFQNCSGILWMSVGNPNGYHTRNFHLTPQRETNDVQIFITFVLPKIKQPFTIVSTDGDHSMPYSALSAKTLLDYPLCQGWYTQNYDASIVHPKMHPIPIGFSLHADFPGMWSYTNVSENIHHMLHLRRKGLTAVRDSGTHLLVPFFTMRPNRKGAAKALHCVRTDNTTLPYARLDPTGMNVLWENYTQYRFGFSPPGAGLDAHRTWEMLFFGMIPIVASSPIDPLFHGLPVLIVKDFSEMCALGFFQEAWERLKPLWPAPDHVFTTDWWLRNVTAH